MKRIARIRNAVVCVGAMAAISVVPAISAAPAHASVDPRSYPGAVALQGASCNPNGGQALSPMGEDLCAQAYYSGNYAAYGIGAPGYPGDYAPISFEK